MRVRVRQEGRVGRGWEGGWEGGNKERRYVDGKGEGEAAFSDSWSCVAPFQGLFGLT